MAPDLRLDDDDDDDNDELEAAVPPAAAAGASGLEVDGGAFGLGRGAATGDTTDAIEGLLLVLACLALAPALTLPATLELTLGLGEWRRFDPLFADGDASG